MFFVLFQPIMQKKIFFYRFFGADLVPSQTRSGIMIDTTCRRWLGPAVAQVSAASGAGGSGERHRWVQWVVQVCEVNGAGGSGERHRWVQWVVQVSEVNGAGGCGEYDSWCRSVR